MTQELGRTTAADTEWFTRDRFGLFIHWGIYALPPATNGSNSARDSRRGLPEVLRPLLPRPLRPRKVGQRGEERGHEVLRRHDQTSRRLLPLGLGPHGLQVTNTPWGEDLIAPMVEAFRAEGMKVGFYHSLIDWHHPEFPVDGLPQARRQGVHRGQQRPRHRPLPRVPARPDPRAPDPLRPGRCHVVRLLLLGPGLGRQGQGRLGL